MVHGGGGGFGHDIVCVTDDDIATRPDPGYHLTPWPNFNPVNPYWTLHSANI